MRHPDRVPGLIFLAVAAATGFLFAPKASQEWHLQNVAGHMPELSFSLTDDHGDNVTADMYKGDVVLLYFGFTGCSAECPVTMDRVGRLLAKMGAPADGVRVLFVSIDPAHDSPPRLKEFLSAFDGVRMRGLTGTSVEIASLAKRYRTAWRPGGDIVHGNTVYIFDRDGKARLVMTPRDRDSDAIDDLLRIAAR
jgi:protein SCO1